MQHCSRNDLEPRPWELMRRFLPGGLPLCDPECVAWNLPLPRTIPPPARLVWYRIRNEFEIRGQTGLTGDEGLYILAEPSPLGERNKHFNS